MGQPRLVRKRMTITEHMEEEGWSLSPEPFSMVSDRTCGKCGSPCGKPAYAQEMSDGWHYCCIECDMCQGEASSLDDADDERNAETRGPQTLIEFMAAEGWTARKKHSLHHRACAFCANIISDNEPHYTSRSVATSAGHPDQKIRARACCDNCADRFFERGLVPQPRPNPADVHVDRARAPGGPQRGLSESLAAYLSRTSDLGIDDDLEVPTTFPLAPRDRSPELFHEPLPLAKAIPEEPRQAEPPVPADVQLNDSVASRLPKAIVQQTPSASSNAYICIDFYTNMRLRALSAEMGRTTEEVLREAVELMSVLSRVTRRGR